MSSTMPLWLWSISRKPKYKESDFNDNGWFTKELDIYDPQPNGGFVRIAEIHPYSVMVGYPTIRNVGVCARRVGAIAPAIISDTLSDALRIVSSARCA